MELFQVDNPKEKLVSSGPRAPSYSSTMPGNDIEMSKPNEQQQMARDEPEPMEFETIWSWLPAVMAEFIGTALFVATGCASVTLATHSTVCVPLAHGFAIAILITTFGSLSGGHFNPCVTLGACLAGALSPLFGVLYAVAQLLGGILGAAFCKGFLTNTVYVGITGGAHTLGDGVYPGQAVLLEIIISCALVQTVLMTAVDSRGRSPLAPFAIGGAVALGIFAALKVSGGSMNPARSLGPALVVSSALDSHGRSAVWDHHWVYYVGPIVGSLIAALLYRVMFAAPDKRIGGRKDSSIGFETRSSDWGSGKWCVVVVILLLIVAISLSLVSVIFEAHTNSEMQELVEELKITRKGASAAGSSSGEPSCNAPSEDPSPEPSVPGVFDPMSPDEIAGAKAYMLQNSGIDLATVEEAWPKKPFIRFMELFPAKKSDVLRHLDEGFEQPAREAIVHVVRWDLTPPVFEEYVVGPLPNPTQHRLFKNPSYRRSPVKYNSYVGVPNDKSVEVVIHEACTKLDNVLQETFGIRCCNFTVKDNPCILFITIPPYDSKDGDLTIWHWSYLGIAGGFLHALPFQFRADCDKTNITKCNLKDVFYGKKSYDSVGTLLNQYANGAAFKYPAWGNPDKIYSSMKRRGKPVPEDGKRGPRMMEPDGHRFTVDGHHVKYMNWDIDVGFQTSEGLQMYNVQYSGERILYELGLKEMISFYGADNPAMRGSQIFDTSWFIGKDTRGLMAGVDCPETAYMMDVYTTYFMDEPLQVKNGICVFEYASAMPHKRRVSERTSFHGSDYYAGMQDYYLVIRTIATVGNYDYIFDYVFHTDGVIEVKIGLTGFIYTGPWSAKEQGYGFELAPGIVGNIHHHMFHIKADFDVAGTSNRFVTYLVKADKQENNYQADPVIQYMRKAERTVRKTEKEAAIRYDFNKPTLYIVESNSSKTQTTGLPRGYAIVTKDFSKALVPEDEITPMTGAKWAYNQVAVTKRHDSEMSSTTVYQQDQPYDPVIDFQDFIDNDENIEGEDLVTWVSMGKLHLPRTEDLPVTTTPSATLSLLFMPYNYFEEDPTMGSLDNVYVVPKPGGGFDVSGPSSEGGCSYSFLDFIFPDIWRNS